MCAYLLMSVFLKTQVNEDFISASYTTRLSLTPFAHSARIFMGSCWRNWNYEGLQNRGADRVADLEVSEEMENEGRNRLKGKSREEGGKGWIINIVICYSGLAISVNKNSSIEPWFKKFLVNLMCSLHACVFGGEGSLGGFWQKHNQL